MVDVQDAYPCIPKARETSQKQGFTASDYGGHRRLFRGQGCWGPARAFRPSDGAQNRIQTWFFHGPKASGALPRSGPRLARPEPSCGIDKRVTFKNPSLRPVMRATTIDGIPNAPAPPIQSRLRGRPLRRERGTRNLDFCGLFCNIALV